MVFSEVVGTLSFLQPQTDDNIVDRLHYYYTSTFLLVVAVLISLKMFGGRPIECWLPAEYKASWEDYSETFCWARSTYYIPFNEPIPVTDQEREVNMVSYYQWAPFFLVLCAFLFYAPCLIWRTMYDRSGIRLRDIIKFANDPDNVQTRIRERNIAGLAEHLGSIFKHRYSMDHRIPCHKQLMKFINIRYYEAYLTWLYLGIKLMFLLNVLGQMFLMNRFLQTDDYDIYGIGVIRDLLNNRPWSESGNFPRVTYCDMDIRILGNVQRHTVQCVLVINIFTEKVFVLLWIWYSILASCTLISLILWGSSLILLEQRKKFITRRLELADVDFRRRDYSKELTEFTRDYVKMDGVFVLNMITIHSGLLICAEITDYLWEKYKNENGISDGKSPLPGLDGAKPPDTPGFASRRKTSVLMPLVSRDDMTTPQPTSSEFQYLRAPSTAPVK